VQLLGQKMPALFSKPRHLVQKIGANLRLARRDPEQFGRNLAQFTNPELFERRLMDVIHTTPMHVRYSDQHLPGPVRLNVLDASWSPRGMTGGPNTVINLACRVAQRGIAVRLVSTADQVRLDPAWLRAHAQTLVGEETIPEIELLSAADRERPLEVGPKDVFLATHWRTAQQLKPVLPLLPNRQFFYMLQDFEPGFYSWSSNYALAVETFNLDFWPIINESTLARYIFAQPFGRLGDPVLHERAMVFEPAVDRSLFHPAPVPSRARRRLLFYARPSGSSARNMVGLGLLALRQIAATPVFKNWEFLSIGSREGIPELSLGNGHKLIPAPWMGYKGYADLLREADVLLCPMLSPHTSYPVLEMAACGGLAVTNSFVTKTQDMLQKLSPNIIAAEPTVEGLAEGTLQAARRVTEGIGKGRHGRLNMPSDWASSLGPVASRMVEVIEQMTGGVSLVRPSAAAVPC